MGNCIILEHLKRSSSCIRVFLLSGVKSAYEIYEPLPSTDTGKLRN